MPNYKRSNSANFMCNVFELNYLKFQNTPGTITL